MKLRDYVLGAIRHQQTPTVPWTLGFEGDVAERIDQHYGNAEWRTRMPAYMVGVGAVDTDMSEPIGTTHRRDGYGGIWRVDQRPWHLETPPLKEASFAGYDFPKPEKFFRPAWKEAAFKTCAQRKDSFLVGALGWGLFERSWTLRGFENALMDAISDEDFFAEMLDRLAALYLEFVRYTVDLPIDAIHFGDDWGDQRGVIIGADRWRRLIKPRWEKVYRATHEAGKIVMHHSCGSVAEIMPDLVEIGVDVLESCQPEAAGMNPYELKRQWGDKITFWGCLGSQSTVPFGTPAEIRTEVKRLCREMGKGGGYILAPAKGLQPETSTANAVAVLEAFIEESARC
jgi:uroporphyrinogen decarboxylase